MVDEVVGDLPVGSGPFSLTTIVDGVNPGEWTVTAELVTRRPGGRPRSPMARKAGPDVRRPLEPAAWSWRHWALVSSSGAAVHSGPRVLARRPGVVVGIWPTMVALGIAVGMLVQALLLRRAELGVGSGLVVSVTTVAAGVVAAKAWYLAQRQPHESWNGWCIQGFVLAVAVVALVVVPLVGLPLGEYLDVTAPALFLGMAIGRVGCFFAGCCVGRPTGSRFGVWSSNRRIGVRRVPTQLLESALALSVAAGALVVVLAGADEPDGLLLAAAFGAYTLCRQGLLRLREASRRPMPATVLTALVAGAMFVGAFGWMAWR